jgi:hypothetical protein
MHEYNIQDIGDNDLMLTRRENYDKQIKGLPPSHSSTLFLKNDEIDELIKVLENYANERGNKKLQSND